jgi:uncharacterized membrane protein YphA (DoxX/SURF4 family)
VRLHPRSWGGYFIALVWLLNGLLAKVLGLVPRHVEIVGQILGATYAKELTVLIGVGEILLAVWILLGRFPRITAIGQIALIMTMNVLEAMLAPEFLLWGRLNFLFALLFCGFIYYDAFGRAP